MPACSGRKCPSSFREGGRFYHPCAADIADATPYQSTASPIRASPTRAAPIRASPIRAAPAPLLPQPATPTLTSPPPLRLPPATPFLTLPTSLPPLSDTEAPHGPQPLPLGLKCRHGPRFFCSSARSAARPVFLQLFYGTSHSRSPSLLCPGHKKTDGTAQRSVRRQKATNLSRQHHRGSSSTRQVSARA